MTHALNEDIKLFPQVTPITDDMKLTYDGVGRLIMLDRYAFKDTKKETLKVGDTVVLTVKNDPQFPARGIGKVKFINANKTALDIKLEESYAQYGDDNGIVSAYIDAVDKPLELYYEQIARRNARGLASVEATEELRKKHEDEFYEQLVTQNFVPAGRVLYGAGSEAEVTFFNCYVCPFPEDSRGGISKHRGEVMEIMSRGGGKLISC